MRVFYPTPPVTAELPVGGAPPAGPPRLLGCSSGRSSLTEVASLVGPVAGAHPVQSVPVVTIDDVRELARTLPRSYEVLVRDHVKFRVGRLVYLAFSRDEQIMGSAFPKEQRDGLIASEPEKFLLPRMGDMRYNWVHGRLLALAPDEMRELVIDAWTMVVPKSVASGYLEMHSRST